MAFMQKKLQTPGRYRPWQWWRLPVLTAAHMASYWRGISPLSWAGLQYAPGRRVILLVALKNMYFRDSFSPSCIDLWMVLGLLGDAGVHSVHMEAAKWTHLVICPSAFWELTLIISTMIIILNYSHDCRNPPHPLSLDRVQGAGACQPRDIWCSHNH